MLPFLIEMQVQLNCKGKSKHFLHFIPDPDYLAFLESLNEKAEPLPSAEVHLEEIEAKKLEKGN